MRHSTVFHQLPSPSPFFKTPSTGHTFPPSVPLSRFSAHCFDLFKSICKCVSISVVYEILFCGESNKEPVNVTIPSVGNLLTHQNDQVIRRLTSTQDALKSNPSALSNFLLCFPQSLRNCVSNGSRQLPSKPHLSMTMLT